MTVTVLKESMEVTVSLSGTVWVARTEQRHSQPQCMSVLTVTYVS